MLREVPVHGPSLRARVPHLAHHPGYTHLPVITRRLHAGSRAHVKECYGLKMDLKPVSNDLKLTFRADYLPFGLVLRRMLQESSSSEGPGLPRSIHSIQHFDEIQDTTLMRMLHHHETQEF